MMKSKKAITTQTFFYILMSIVFIWILYFGINNIFNLQGEISEQELILIRDNVRETLTFCDDPLNRGARKIFEFDSKSFNSFCYIGSQENTELESSINETLSMFRESNENVVLFQVEYSGVNVQDSQVIDTFNVFLENRGKDICFFPFNSPSGAPSSSSRDKLYVEVEC